MQRFVRISLLAIALSAASAPAAADTSLRFGVVPQQAAARLATVWTPVLALVSENIDRRVTFHTAPDIPEFERRLARGDYDVAYMNPYHYTVFSEAPGYRAIAKEAEKRIQGLVVVRRDSAYGSIEELAGEAVAFPAPAAFAASLLPRAQFESAALSIKPVYVQSHDSVYESVARGLFPAGGGIERTFRNMPTETQRALRVLWRTERYTPHAIATHPDLPGGIVDAMQSALIALDQTPVGRAALAQLGFKALKAASDSDWNDVRALNIELLEGAAGD